MNSEELHSSDLPAADSAAAASYHHRRHSHHQSDDLGGDSHGSHFLHNHHNFHNLGKRLNYASNDYEDEDAVMLDSSNSNMKYSNSISNTEGLEDDEDSLNGSPENSLNNSHRQRRREEQSRAAAGSAGSAPGGGGRSRGTVAPLQQLTASGGFHSDNNNATNEKQQQQRRNSCNSVAGGAAAAHHHSHSHNHSRSLSRSRSRSVSSSPSSAYSIRANHNSHNHNHNETLNINSSSSSNISSNNNKSRSNSSININSSSSSSSSSSTTATIDGVVGTTNPASAAAVSTAGGRQQRTITSSSSSSSSADVDVMEIADEDASFILGSAGRTKKKLSRVCGAELNIKQEDSRTILEIRGSFEARERAKLYVDFVMQQRVGPVRLKPEQQKRDDLTCIKVPHECVGYVTGRKGLGLRSIEEEWATLMFFTDLKHDRQGDHENLAIFAPDARKRRGAELKVMSAVEQKLPGHYTTNEPPELVDDAVGFGTDHVPILQDDYSYALGKEGATRKKLAKASGAILEYVGRIAFISGVKSERERARDYLKWLCLQRTSYVHVEIEGRNDCLVVQVPTNCVAYVTGSKGSSLRRIEEHSGTFIFLDGTSRGKENERLLVFGCNADGRAQAKNLVLQRIHEKLTGRSSAAAAAMAMAINCRGVFGGGIGYWRGRSRSERRDGGRSWWSAYEYSGGGVSHSGPGNSSGSGGNRRSYYSNAGMSSSSSSGGGGGGGSYGGGHQYIYGPSRGNDYAANERCYDNNGSSSRSRGSNTGGNSSSNHDFRDHHHSRDAPYYQHHNHQPHHSNNPSSSSSSSSSYRYSGPGATASPAPAASVNYYNDDGRCSSHGRRDYVECGGGGGYGMGSSSSSNSSSSRQTGTGSFDRNRDYRCENVHGSRGHESRYSDRSDDRVEMRKTEDRRYSDRADSRRNEGSYYRS